LKYRIPAVIEDLTKENLSPFVITSFIKFHIERAEVAFLTYLNFIVIDIVKEIFKVYDRPKIPLIFFLTFPKKDINISFII